MKTIEYPIQLTKDTSSKTSLSINKRTLYYLLLISSAAGGLFLPSLFVAFGLLLVCGLSIYCYTLYKEISTLDFGSEKYSITLEEIIEDLEG